MKLGRQRRRHFHASAKKVDKILEILMEVKLRFFSERVNNRSPTKKYLFDKAWWETVTKYTTNPTKQKTQIKQSKHTSIKNKPTQHKHKQTNKTQIHTNKHNKSKQQKPRKIYRSAAKFASISLIALSVSYIFLFNKEFKKTFRRREAIYIKWDGFLLVVGARIEHYSGKPTPFSFLLEMTQTWICIRVWIHQALLGI